MAEKYSFVGGVLGTDFLQLKTTDNIYLKDLLEKEVFPLLAMYNEEVTGIEKLLCYRYDDAVANSKQLWVSSTVRELSDIEKPGTGKAIDSWNRPIPLVRVGDASRLTLEVIKQMSSKQITNWMEGILVADKKNLVKTAFKNMCTKTPAGAVDALTSQACTGKAFWNADGVDTPRTNGQYSFANTHNHYVAYTGVGTAGANLIAAMALVHEHEGMDGQGIWWAGPGLTGVGAIQAETTYYRGLNLSPLILTGNGVPYNQGGLAQALVTGGIKLAKNMRVVGTYKEALVVETPDLPANYYLYTMHTGDNSDLAPMGWRENPQFKGLMLWSSSGGNPIIGQDAQYRRYLGMNVWNRDAGVAAYILSTNGSTWAEPTFA